MSEVQRIVVKADKFSVGPRPDASLFIPSEAFTSLTSNVVIRRDQIEAIEINDEFVTIRYKKTDS